MTNTQSRRVAIITGASSGIGKAAAISLATQGWHVIAHGRDAQRTAAAEQEIRAAASADAKVDMIRGDLALLSDTARMAADIAGLTNKVHALLNNAGGVRPELYITPEGNEATFAGNHLGHFLLTKKLLPLLRNAAADGAAGSVRIVSVSSTGHLSAPPIDWNNLQLTHNWISGQAYCLAKLHNILFTRELAKRLAADGIVAHAMHPGVVDSNFKNHCEPGMKTYMETLNLLPPEIAAGTLTWLASAPEPGNSTGLYYYDRKALEPSAAALDAEAAARLWQESEKLLARAGF